MRTSAIIALVITLSWSASSTGQENTLVDAIVGEWALYSTANPSMQERHSVVARQRQVLVVRIDSIINGKVISSRTENYDIDNPVFLQGAEGRSQINVGGRSYNCMVVNRSDRTFYYSNQVPVSGLVKVEKGNQTVKEVINFGQ